MRVIEGETGLPDRVPEVLLAGRSVDRFAQAVFRMTFLVVRPSLTELATQSIPVRDNSLTTTFKASFGLLSVRKGFGSFDCSSAAFSFEHLPAFPDTRASK
jgi:hypothetical protein